MKKSAILLLLLSFTLFTGCAKKESTPNALTNAPAATEKPAVGNAIIKVNDTVITQEMFDSAMAKLNPPGEHSLNLKDPKNKLIYLTYKDMTINELLARTLIDQEAAKRNIKISNGEIDKAVNSVAERIGGKDKLDAALKLHNVNKNQFLEEVKRDLVIKKLLDNLSAGINISDGEVKDFYTKNKAEKFTNPDMVKAEHILVSVPGTDYPARIEAENPSMSKEQINKKVNEETAKAKAKAEKILAQIKANPSSFGDIAKKYSDDASSAQNGGDLGFFTRQQMVTPFSKVAFSLTPGQIGMAKTQFGYHIIKVDDRKKAGTMPLAEVKNDIKRYLADQKRVLTLQKLIESAKYTSDIKYLNSSYNPKTIKEEAKKLTKELGGNNPLSPVAVKKAAK